MGHRGAEPLELLVPVNLQLAMRLPKLRHLTPAEAAVQLHVTEEQVREACRMLYLAMRNDDAKSPRPPVDKAARVANFERMPKSWQDRMRKKDERR